MILKKVIWLNKIQVKFKIYMVVKIFNPLHLDNHLMILKKVKLVIILAKIKIKNIYHN